MSQFSSTFYNQLKDKFELVTKKIFNYENRSLPSDLTERENRINQYKAEIVEVYNNLVEYIALFYNKCTPETKARFRERVTGSKSKVLRALTAIDLELNLPENFDLIDINKIVKAGVSTDETAANSSSVFLQAVELNHTESRPTTPNSLLSYSENEGQSENMPQSFLDFLQIATKVLNYKYNGDPLSLETFLKKVNLLDKATEAGNKDNLKEYVLSCLEGKALEVVPLQPNTLEDVVIALREKISFDTPKVVEGRLLALKADNTKLNDFATKAEALADDFARALRLKKIPPDTANEMAIDKTIELCQMNAKSEGIRNILASVQFTSPKEVVAKYIVETRVTAEQKQILAFRAQNSQNRGWPARRNNFGRNWNNNGNGQHRNGHGNGNYRGRGRGNYRGNFRGNFRGNNNRGRNNVFYAENQQAPPPGAQEQQNVVPLNQAD